MRSSSSEVGRSFHTRTCPSRPHVATRWYERPHDGAHEMEVMAYGAVTSSVTDPDSTGGERSSERSVIGRREGDSCIIYDHPVSAFREKENEGKIDLDNARHAAAGREDLTPVSLLAPRDRPPTVGLATSCASLDGGLLLLLLQRGGNEGSVCGRGSGYLSWGRCRIGMRTRRQRGRKRWDVRFFQHHPVCQSGRLEALVHAQVIVRGDCSLF
jgi:hypothetical protein